MLILPSIFIFYLGPAIVLVPTPAQPELLPPLTSVLSAFAQAEDIPPLDVLVGLCPILVIFVLFIDPIVLLSEFQLEIVDSRAE